MQLETEKLSNAEEPLTTKVKNAFGLPSLIVCAVVALLHFVFMIMEMFLWKVYMADSFGFDDKEADTLQNALINQGIYNGGVCAMILFAMYQLNITMMMFIMICVIIYAIVGAATVSVSIIFVQGLPAMIALGLLIWKYLKDSQ